MKDLIKKTASCISFVFIAPYLMLYYLRSLFLGHNRAILTSSQTLSLIPGLLGQYLRRAFYSRALVECHRSAVIEFGVLFSQSKAAIGENAYIGPYCQIGLAHIERNVLLASAVQVPSGPRTHGTHKTSIPIRDQSGNPQVVTIGEGSWIGSGAVIMAHVGRNSIIGAGSVVTHPIPDLVIAAGVPAKIIKHRTESNSAN